MTALFYSIQVIMSLILQLVTPKTTWNKFVPVMVSTLHRRNADQTLRHKGTNQANPQESRAAVRAPLGRPPHCAATLSSSVRNGKKESQP